MRARTYIKCMSPVNSEQSITDRLRVKNWVGETPKASISFIIAAPRGTKASQEKTRKWIAPISRYFSAPGSPIPRNPQVSSRDQAYVIMPPPNAMLVLTQMHLKIPTAVHICPSSNYIMKSHPKANGMSADWPHLKLARVVESEITMKQYLCWKLFCWRNHRKQCTRRRNWWQNGVA